MAWLSCRDPAETPLSRLRTSHSSTKESTCLPTSSLLEARVIKPTQSHALSQRPDQDQTTRVVSCSPESHSGSILALSIFLSSFFNSAVFATSTTSFERVDSGCDMLLCCCCGVLCCREFCCAVLLRCAVSHETFCCVYLRCEGWWCSDVLCLKTATVLAMFLCVAFACRSKTRAGQQDA